MPSAAAYQARVRAALVEETLSAAPRAPVALVALAILLVAMVWLSPACEPLLRLLAVIAGLSAVPLLARRLLPARPWSPSATRRIETALAGDALIAGLVFGAIPVVACLSRQLGEVSTSESLVMLAAVALAMASAALRGPIALVECLQLAPIAAGGSLALVLGDRAHVWAAGLILVAAGALAIGLRSRERASRAAQLDRLRVVDLTETMDALLTDAESGTHGWIWETDAAGRLRNVGAGLAASIGLPLARLEGALVKTILSPQAPDVAVSAGARACRRAIADRKPFRDTLVEIATPAGVIWWRLSGRPLQTETGTFAGFRGVGSDVTAARDTEARIAYLANYDLLTGLANRVQFQAHAAKECAAAARDGHWRALLYLDLDGFKTINDSLGHAAGDLVLREVARRLTALAPTEALVSRLGGDEFALWYPMTTPARAEALAQGVIEALGAPFDIEGSAASVAVSVGIAYTPKDTIVPDALLGNADLALYRAKADGRGIVRTFSRNDELAVVEKRKLDGDLKLALARGEFELHYQPLVGLTTGEVVSFEALIRWHSPTRGLVSPADFIPAAEASGIIAGIGRWVLAQACRDAVSWPAKVGVAVNVSPKQFGDADFLRSVALALQTSGLPAARLEIEVTEGVFLGDSTTASAHLTALRERGIRVALDDFGTGYSSLSYLTRFPVDKIKIDRSFVQNLARLEDQAIVEAILTLARRLSIRVTAEGVETAEQALALKTRRCDELQGYLLSKPRPNADVPAMLSSAPAALRDAMPAGADSPLALALRKRSA